MEALMYDRIVVAVDGSDCASRAVDIAAELAAAFAAEVIVVHLAETIAAWTVAVEAETPVEAVNLGDTAVRRLKDRGISARSEVGSSVRGGVALRIVELAE